MKYNILHVITRLPIGGVENMLFKVVKGYDKSRYNVSICCINGGGEIAAELARFGYKVDILGEMRSHGFGFGAVRGIFRILKRDDIHILRTHQYHANLYGRIAGVLARVPVIIPSFHNIYESPDKPKLHRRIFNHLLGYFSDMLVAVSNTIAADVIRYDHVSTKKIAVIYNGIEMDKFNSPISKQDARKTFHMPCDEIIVGSVGRLTEQKGHHYLIEAASAANNSCVAIAGDGPLIEHLKDLADRLNSKCFFPGMLKHEDVLHFLQAIDIFCFPSLWEGLPSALIEAMAAGVPVVASDIQPHREVIGDAGIFVPPGNPEKLAEALSMLSDDSSARHDLGLRARERAAMFSIENTVKSYETLFEDIMKKKGLL